MSLHRDQRSKAILDILSWLQTFSIFSAVLSSEDSTKEKAAGLAAHSYLILLMSKDLQGSQWSQYEQNFCEWAAAKGQIGRAEFHHLWLLTGHPTALPFQKLQLQDPSRTGRLISTSATKGMPILW